MSRTPGERVMVTESITTAELILHIRGELDAATAADTSLALLAATADLAPPALAVLDLTEVRVLLASGARVLIDVINTCAARDVRVHLVVDPAGVVPRVLDAALPEGIARVFTDLDQARRHDG